MNSIASSVKRGLWLGLVIAVAVIGARSLSFLWQDLPVFRSLKPLPVYGQIPEFHLTERSGEPFGLKDLKGHVWIANFIFTRCAGPCPLMSIKMKQLQDQLHSVTGIRFVSISVDPEYDTPEVLTGYADRYEADQNKWVFLTGGKEDIFKLSEQHFHLGAGEIPEEEQASFGHRIHHSSKFVLVDKAGQIRGYYDSLGQTSLEHLIKNAKILL